MNIGKDLQVRARRITTIAMRKIKTRCRLISVMYDRSPIGLDHPARAQLLAEELLTENQSLRTRTTTVQRRLLHFILKQSDKLWSGAFISFCVMVRQTLPSSRPASLESMC